ncbi:response regulator [Waterburya agarophytonicola K14]|uniref:Response regulator n=1 Tax=Waterburya agarophytonicola KI4 TaxID=2874699 RepID=A0A964BNN7_9CYAN|nr:response regulator [Waterburya agarophytonicola]MCC0175971.1 response regulator [Waterburya agarophytonicola KI4]
MNSNYLWSIQPQYRILVVDDQELNRELLIQLLESIGFEVQTADNGKKAIAIWQEWQPDLILMDIRMPVMDGYSATQKIKNNSTFPTKIIALTASALEEECSVILATGCDDFMRKPFQADELFSLMTKHLGVCYTYAEAFNSTESSASLLQLDNDSLAMISDELLQELQQSIMAIDLDKISKIVDRISQENQLLAQTINRHINNFEYEHILKLISLT